MNVLEFEQSIAELDANIEKFKAAATRENRDIAGEAERLQQERDRVVTDFFRKLTTWDNVLLARHKDRPYTLDYVPLITEDFLELHGDRRFGDDGALVGGFANLGGIPIMLIGQQKGRDLKERQKRNFGYVRPEGYRKALRLMQMASKFRIPIVTLVDTPGADPNVTSEERGISEAIAYNLQVMSVLPTPIVSVVIGEGGSGGALGIAVADRVLMLEHSIYSVIAPEGCASILWRDPNKGSDAAAAMRVSAKEVKSLGLVDEVIPEPLGGAHRSLEATAAAVKEAVLRHLNEVRHLSSPDLLKTRHAKFRALGRYAETLEEAQAIVQTRGKETPA
jgi:acetyl-CoA carboxylase carboxyl transferase subunit alpha